jgi:ubiquinone/menaquinone biosynthesis C-methylase UbiE
MYTESVPVASRAGSYRPLGVHLVGSVPLASADAVFRALSRGVGDRLRRIPDGETGPRADWIVWQYPVLSSRPQFEVAPPAPEFYRALPRLRLREGESGEALRFDALGYAEAARSSYRTFGLLKRDGVVPRGCKFQVSLPTPLAPISAFVALDDQGVVERAYEVAMADELAQLLDDIPHDQLALQWDVNFEFGMLEGALPVWFSDVKAAVLERLIRMGQLVPADVELGFHFCHGHDEQDPHRSHRDLGRMVEVGNALALTLDRPLNWVHVPVGRDDLDAATLAPLRELRLHAETELYLGVLRLDEDEERTLARLDAAHSLAGEFGLATPCGWGRMSAARVDELIDAHRRLSRPVTHAGADSGTTFEWPPTFPRVPDEEWVGAPVEAFGLHYDTVENHGWYRNLDLTVEQLAHDLSPGDVLIDYSGGTGILLDRLRLRIFDRPVGMVIVDSSPKFLRVAVDKFRHDERIAFRRLRYLREERRLQYVDEVLGETFVERPANVLVSTNAIHLYDDLDNTLRSWARVLERGGRVRINTGNVRNPRARDNEWIIDETVYVVHEVATGLVRTHDRWSSFRAVLEDEERLARYLAYRDRVFLAPRPLQFYVEALEGADLTVDEVTERTIEADVGEWYEFLAAYADAVLGWAGGAEKVDGRPPDEGAVAERLALLRQALDVIFGGRPTFRCCWTYISAIRR